jgi:D-glycero-D-manno-heptose 1,7-bisphosphate phosphatase
VRPAVFLDRDGTINVRPPEHEYLTDPSEFRWLPGALDGMLKLAQAGLPLIVVSNQRGVARGLVTERTLSQVEAVIQAALGPYGHRVEAFRYCPHDLAAGCECRKPKPGLLRAAARDLDLDLEHSWMIGDTEADIEAGRAAGCRTIRLAPAPVSGTATAASLLEAAALVLDGRPTV